MIDKEKIEQQIAAWIEEREQVVANANAQINFLNGQITAYENLLNPVPVAEVEAEPEVAVEE